MWSANCSGEGSMCGKEEVLSATSSISKNTAPSILSLRYSCLALREGSICQEAVGLWGGEDCSDMSRHLSTIQGGFTSIHSIVTAATVRGQPVYYRKGGVAMHSSVYMHVINSQWLKFNAVNGQSPENQEWSMPKRAGQSFDLQL